ncbi:metallophosphoesterase family protein [Magnetospira thiophila]
MAFGEFLTSLWRADSAAPREARVLDGVRAYAIGDIHGRSDLLAALHRQIAEDLAAHEHDRSVLIYLGDYVDRGPDSRGVLEMLRAAPPTDAAVYLKGNHEAMMLEFVEHDRFGPSWFQYGGRETAESYGVELMSEAPVDQRFSLLSKALRAAVPDPHMAFLRALVPSYRLGDYFFAHAGVHPQVSLDDQSEQDLLWIREPFLNWRGDLGAVVVHGHTIATEPELRAHRIGIDTGAYASDHLTCLVLDGAERQFLST